MSEAVLNEKVSYIVDKVENIESLITRRLLEDKEKNSLIEELKKHLIYRQELDKGAKFAPLMLEILKVMDRLKSDDIVPLELDLDDTENLYTRWIDIRDAGKLTLDMKTIFSLHIYANIIR